jgi:hypothetical protein
MSSIVERLTEGMVNRDMQAEGHALLNKWEKTGLLEGLTNSRSRSTMARLLENQAKELLRESSTMSGGDVEGFAAVAFPIVRRVFAGLIANDLVSVQPMSLPSGLIFFLDFTVSSPSISSEDPGDHSRLGYVSASSLYGGGRVGADIVSGAVLTSEGSIFASEGPYNLNNGYSSPTGSALCSTITLSPAVVSHVDWGQATGSAMEKLARWDPNFLSGAAGTGTALACVSILASGLDQFNLSDLQAIQVSSSAGAGFTSVGPAGGIGDTGGIAQARIVRRLSQWSGSDHSNAGGTILLFFQGVGTNGAGSPAAINSARLADGVVLSLAAASCSLAWPQTDDIVNSPTLGAVIGQAEWGLENEANIPEIDIKVDSVAITARTKKLKAKWTPELGQDLNAYHNLDAEVELTSILSEQIALEIDREVMADLINEATAGTYYWSRAPGLFLRRDTGVEIGASSAAPDFTGTVSEWYETLVETINDISAQIHRKTLRGGANFIVVGPEVANILEFTAGFRASITADDETGTVGAVKVGSLTKKFDVIVDPYFLRNVVLVGRRGSSFLESGYVYAPYVPLQTTPTIFGPEDFVPRKGVMTRYGKKMVRPDMYGLVVVRGLLGESGATS